MLWLGFRSQGFWPYRAAAEPSRCIESSGFEGLAAYENPEADWLEAGGWGGLRIVDWFLTLEAQASVWLKTLGFHCFKVREPMVQ